MNIIYYQEKLNTDCNTSIMGGKTYFTKLRHYSEREDQKYRTAPYDQFQRNVYDTNSLQDGQRSRFFICRPAIKSKFKWVKFF